MTGNSGIDRIVLVDLPQLAADLIKATLANDKGSHVVGVANDVEELAKVIDSTRANVLIVGSEHSELPREIREFIESRMPPNAAVIPVDGSGVVLYTLRPQAVALGDVSCTELVAAIRHSIGNRSGG